MRKFKVKLKEGNDVVEKELDAEWFIAGKEWVSLHRWDEQGNHQEIAAFSSETVLAIEEVS